MNLKDEAAKMRAWAKQVRAEAAMVEKAADIMDPPQPKQRRRRRKAGEYVNAGVPVENPKPPVPPGTTVLGLGTGGRTTALDPDAEQVAETLVYTTEEPA